MPDDPAPPAEVPAEPVSPVPSQGGPAPTPAPEPTITESTHLPANESIREAPPESISDLPVAPEPVVQPSSVTPTETPSVVTPRQVRGSIEMLQTANTVRRAAVQKNLDSIITEVEKSGTISNNGVQKLLRTSNATATRYLSMLVKQGKIKKEGKGRGVVYVKV